MAEDQNQLNEASPKANAQSSSSHFPEDSHAPQLQTNNHTLQIASMEVHHPHHVTHKKKWTEYLLEFFMLFLAVFLGFIAENIREHYTEHSREKEYMRSLLIDLRSDTSIMAKVILKNERYAQDDSLLVALLQQAKYDSLSLKNIYALYPQTEKFYEDIDDPKTFEQLKNTGDLRLIRSQAVHDSMSSYYQKVSRQTMYRNEVQSLVQSTYNFSNKIFDFYSFNTNISAKLSLITTDAPTIKEYLNKLYLLIRNIKKYDIYLGLIRRSAINFIGVIQSKYNFKDESTTNIENDPIQ